MRELLNGILGMVCLSSCYSVLLHHNVELVATIVPHRAKDWYHGSECPDVRVSYIRWWRWLVFVGGVVLVFSGIKLAADRLNQLEAKTATPTHTDTAADITHQQVTIARYGFDCV